MENVQQIVDSLGRERIKAKLGIDDPVISHHLRRGSLPALWYAALCELAGHDLPRTLFTFKGIAA